MDFPTLLKAKCPDCGRSHYFPFRNHETKPYKRTCGKCGRRWVVVVKPVKVTDDRAVHVLDWNPVEK